MKNTRLSALVAFFSCSAFLLLADALADQGPKLPFLKNMHLETSLVNGQMPGAVIAVSDSPKYLALARELQTGIQKTAGCVLPIRPDSSFTDDMFREYHVLALGNLMTNQVCARLYSRHLLQVDAGWPGKDGYLLQTIHDPMGLGKNVVCLSGSDLAGVRKSVHRFLEHLQTAGTTFGPLFDLGTALKVPASLSSNEIESILKRMKGSGFRQVGGRASQFGRILRKYQTPGYGRLFRKTIELLWQEMDKIDRCDDLRSTKWLPLYWDNIEACSQFSPEERFYISSFFYAYAQKVLYAFQEVRPSRGPHGNNWNAEGSYLAGLYFYKYYPGFEIGKRLMDRMDRYYAGDLKHWKVAEDCPGYGNITLEANLLYALTRRRMDYFKSGNVRKAADYAALITTNLGTVAGFGDVPFGRNYAVDVLPIAAWFYQDGSYLWWYEKIGGSYPRFQVDILPKTPPRRFLGVQHAPLDEWIYQRNRHRTFPRERCFDKMSFRSGFEPQDEYLLLSGFSYGFHSHPDGNAIINFTDNGYTWLFDDGYMVPEMSEHSTVIVYRNGLARPLPELVRLDQEADLVSTAFTGTTVIGYNGVDWTRNIIWKKERYFLVLDHLVAREDGEYTFQCVWHARGVVGLKGRSLLAESKGSHFRLTNLDGAGLGLKPCHPKHPYGKRLVETVTRRLKQGQSYLFANVFAATGPSEKRAFSEGRCSGALSTLQDGETLDLHGLGPVKIPPGLETDARIFAANASTISATGLSRWKSPSFSFQADRTVSLEVNLKTGKGEILAEEDGKASFGAREIVLKKGKNQVPSFPVWPVDTAALNKLFGVRFDEASQQASAKNSPLKKSPAIVRTLWTFDQFESLVNRSDRAEVKLTASHVPLTPAEANYPVGTLEKLKSRNGNVMFPTGKTITLTIDLGANYDLRQIKVFSRQLISFNRGCGVGRVRALASRDGFPKARRAFGEFTEKTIPPQNARVDYVINSSPTTGRYVRLVCEPLTSKHKVYLDSLAVLGNATPEERLRMALPVRALVAADLDGEGKSEALAAGSDNAIYAFSPAGRRLWSTNLGSRIYQVASVDLNGDGRAEILAGCSNKHFYCLNPDGSQRWDIAPPPRTYARPHYRGVLPFQGPIKIVFTSDLDRDGKPEIILGSGNWRVYCYSAQGKLLWDQVNWAHQPTCGDAFDLDGDGILDPIVGNDYASAQIYNGKNGQILGRLGMTGHAGPSALAAGDFNLDGKADLVCGDRAGRLTFAMPWNGKPKSIEVGASFTNILLADMDTDGRQEVFAASSNGYVYAFDSTGALQWIKNLGDAPSGLAVADADGDGQPELLAACENSRLFVITALGRILSEYSAPGPIQHLCLAELDGNSATRECLIACRGGAVQALRFATH